jgi:hypothetical protein
MHFAASFLVLLAGCSAGPPARAPVKPGEEFNLALGESVRIFQKNAIVLFDRVIDDSRCPVDARCIWEGNARISIKVDGASYEINTSNRFSVREKTADFTVELRRLEPHRVAGAPTKDYVATLFIGVP